jgi:endonuclease/exonuclease/phosphatase (EEP) superfamily protein YafD
MKKIIFSLILVGSFQVFANGSVLCEGSNHSLQLSFSNLVQTRNSDEFVLIDWNAHKLEDERFIQDLAQLAQSADLITIQEGMHSDAFQNQFLKLPFSSSFFKSFCTGDKEATGVMSMSRYMLEENKTLVSPGREPILNTPKVSGYSTLVIPEIGRVHLINTHALNFNFGSKFKDQVDSIAEFIKTLQGPVIWAGDFNTWNDDRKDYLIKHATALGLTHLNPANDKRGLLKLDHVFVRDLNVESIEVLSQYKSSDHVPLRVVFKKVQTQHTLAEH